MSSNEWRRIFLAGAVCVLWWAAACGDDVTTPQAGGKPDSNIIDDDDYSSPPVLECTATTIAGNPCSIQGSVTTSVVAPSTSVSIRVAFYAPAQLSSSGRPADPSTVSASLTLDPPFKFPISFQATVPAGTVYLVEAWLDTDNDGVQDDGDLIGTQEDFTPGITSSPLSLTLSAWTAPG
jgi:hypothetical protein